MHVCVVLVHNIDVRANSILLSSETMKKKKKSLKQVQQECSKGSNVAQKAIQLKLQHHTLAPNK